MGNLDIADLLTMMDPKLTRKQELEEQLIELEKRIKQNAVLREKAKVEADFEEEQTKLDRALAMDVITQDEYNFKISVAKKKVDNFEEIRRVEQQCEMGIITKEEKKPYIPLDCLSHLCFRCWRILHNNKTSLSPLFFCQSFS